MSIKTPYKTQETVASKDNNANSGISSTPDIDNVNHSRYHEKYTFAKDFASSSKSIYLFPEGGFQEVSTVELDKYLPEGLSHGVEEVLNSNNSSSKSYWMIRESSKLLCRIVDEVNSKLLPLSKDTPTNIEIIHKRSVHIPLLTDKEEWPNNVLQVTRYGNHLVNSSKKPLQGNVNYVDISKQSDCVVDSCLSNIYEQIEVENKKTNRNVGFPDKILLTGMYK